MQRVRFCAVECADLIDFPGNNGAVTFAGSEADVEVDDVGAVVETLRRAEFFCEVVIHEEIRREAYRHALQSTRIHALVGFNPLLLLLGYDD